MTLTSAQNQAAKQQGFINWNHACTTSEVEHLEYINGLAMNIYRNNRKPAEIFHKDKVHQRRIIRTLVLCFIASAIIWTLGIWAFRWWNAPLPGERNYSGYGAFEGRRD